ncbi:MULTISPECIES: IclR family transcriptional regulator [unclassified Streptomyces]|uniref:IclR family transcriptional regulator n=1 Tax=unclassified Streptomyces TaxID=2593676 RepID=UPI00168AA81A|nr:MULTISPECIES: IclR family transcriptional regulator [unclassified Streptomyces]MBD3009085.1 IclR family transcriptional regulator [Streptomyces sp. 5-10]
MSGPDTAHGDQEDRPAPTGPRRNTSSSLRRALSIVMFLAEDRGHPRGATLTDLAEGLNLSKSTILRLLAPLREVRLVDQDADSGRYRLGPQNALLGQVYLERLDFRETAAPHLHELVESIGETVHLVVFDPPEIVYIDKVESPQPVRMHSRIGSRQPAYCTAVGKAFLAHASDAVVEQVIARGMPPRTPATITSAERLHAELAAVRERGYAIDDVENEEEIRCVAAPVFDHSGTVATAISVSGPASRVTRDRVAEIGELLLDSTKALSGRLGGTLPPAPAL